MCKVCFQAAPRVVGDRSLRCRPQRGLGIPGREPLLTRCESHDCKDVRKMEEHRLKVMMKKKKEKIYIYIIYHIYNMI